MQALLWGKDLAVYLQQVFYSKSKWCIVFISKEYLEKVYTIHELNSALARQIEQKGEYILPVRWDKDVLVPGLNPTIAYQNANKLTPPQLAQLFIEKLEGRARP